MATALIVAMSLGVSTVAVAQADDLKDKQRQVERDIKGAHDDLDSSSAQLRRAAARLANSTNPGHAAGVFSWSGHRPRPGAASSVRARSARETGEDPSPAGQ